MNHVKHGSGETSERRCGTRILAGFGVKRVTEKGETCGAVDLYVTRLHCSDGLYRSPIVTRYLVKAAFTPSGLKRHQGLTASRRIRGLTGAVETIGCGSEPLTILIFEFHDDVVIDLFDLRMLVVYRPATTTIRRRYRRNLGPLGSLALMRAERKFEGALAKVVPPRTPKHYWEIAKHELTHRAQTGLPT
jgi:hypothetical protein